MPRKLSCLPALALLALLAACSPGTGLAPGLTARMDAPGASLAQAEALGIINDYRRVAGVAPLQADAGLQAEAQRLAAAYAAAGTPPPRPEQSRALRASAGYTTFADTFSGWRNSPADAAVLADPEARRAGIGVANDPASTHGVHWILLLAR